MTIYHKHHIVPRHAGGTDDPDNLVILTVPEHAEAHRLLWERYGRIEDKLAWLLLANLTEEAELARRQLISQRLRGRKGKPLTPETKAKIVASRQGYRHSEETKAKMRGRIVSDETRRKISEKRKGRCSSRKGIKNKHPLSDESRRRISESKRGHHVSDETRKRISETKRKRHRERLGLAPVANNSDIDLSCSSECK